MARVQKVFRYQHLVGEIEQKITAGTYQPGEKLPSIRKLHERLNVSISTIYKAYLELEALGLVEARSKSGYYVAPVRLRDFKAPVFRKISSPPRRVRLSAMINSVVAAINNPELLPLASTTIDTQLLPFKHFSRILKAISQKDLKQMMSYCLSEGYPELRRQLALLMVGVLDDVSPEDIIITNGCMEAVALALLATTRPGDTIAIETPTNFSFLQLLNELGVLVVEVPTDPVEGLDIPALDRLIRKNPVKACLLMPNFHNPLGALMPDEKKKALIGVLDGYGIPAIEDDISAALFFGGEHPKPLKAFDENDRVLTCSSFSKTLAPGLRIGWMIPGSRYREKIQRLKAATTVSTSTLDQYLISQLLAGGGYERQLRRLRKRLKMQMVLTAFAIHKYFPPQTRLAVPQGGSLLWVELPRSVDGLKVYRKALDRHISIIPGEVCSNTGQFKNFIQISCGSPYGPGVEKGIFTLGKIVHKLQKA